MATVLSGAREFSFTSRPTPVPGELRIGWRVPIVVLMLGHSRARRASLAKLHILNDAIRSIRAQAQLFRIVDHVETRTSWQMRVEPAFGRALNYVVGEGFAEWTRAAQRTALQLTGKGVGSWEAISKANDVLVEEKEFLSTAAKAVSENFVSQILRADGVG